MKKTLTCLFVGLFCFGFLSPSVEAAWPFEREEKKKKIIESPAVPYVDDSYQAELWEEFTKSELIFTGRIENIVISRMGFGGPPVPLTRVTFSEIEMLKGQKPAAKTFHYQKSPDDLKFGKGSKVVVALKAKARAAKTPFITRIATADGTNLSLARHGAAVSSGEGAQ